VHPASQSLEAVILLLRAKGHVYAGDHRRAAQAADEASALLWVMAGRPAVGEPDHAGEAFNRAMREPEHVSKPLARALEQIARKVEGD
jgi:hypothetical protein